MLGRTSPGLTRYNQSGLSGQPGVRLANHLDGDEEPLVERACTGASKRLDLASLGMGIASASATNSCVTLCPALMKPDFRRGSLSTMLEEFPLAGRDPPLLGDSLIPCKSPILIRRGADQHFLHLKFKLVEDMTFVLNSKSRDPLK